MKYFVSFITRPGQGFGNTQLVRAELMKSMEDIREAEELILDHARTMFPETQSIIVISWQKFEGN